MRVPFQVVFSLLLVLSSGPARADAPAREINQVVDMVVAQVDSTVMTLSELIAETRVVLLRTHGPARARSATLSPDLLRAVLRAMVSRELLVAEARRLQLREVRHSEVLDAVRKVRALFSTSGDYLRFLEGVGFTIPDRALSGTTLPVPPVLSGILRAELQVQRFTSLRVQTNLAVRGEDVTRCYEANRRLFGSRTLSSVRPIIEQTIRDEHAESTLAEMLRKLEAKARIRFAPDFKPDDGVVSEDEDDGVGLRCAGR